MPELTKEEVFRIATEEAERIKKLSPEKAFEVVQSLVKEYQKANVKALSEEGKNPLFPFLKPKKPEPFALGVDPHYLGFKPTLGTIPESPDIFQDPLQASRIAYESWGKGAGLREAVPQTPEFRAPTGRTEFKTTSEFEKQVGIQKEARLLREKYDPGDRMAAIVEGFLPTPEGWKPVGFNEAFPVHRLGGRLTRMLLLSKMAALKGIATGTAETIHQATPWLIGKSAATPIISQIMNYDIPATLVTKVLMSEWFPAVVGNAVERGLVWSADAFIEKLGRTGSLGEATKAAAKVLPFGLARGAVHVLPFQGIESPSMAGKIGLTKMFGQAVMEKEPHRILQFGADVLPGILAGGIGGTQAVLEDYWEQGNKLKSSALKEAIFAAAWSGFIETIGHKHLKDEWKKFNLEQYLWDKADAYAVSELARHDAPEMSKEALKVLYYRDFKIGLSPTDHSKYVYEQVMKETIPRQFNFLSPEQLSKIQVELAARVQGGENAVDAFGDIVSQFFHAISKVNMPISEIEIPGMVLPAEHRTDFAQKLREQIVLSEKVPLHPPKEAKALQDEVMAKLKAKYPEYDIEQMVDEAQSKLPPKYHTAFAEALQRRLKLSEAVPLHPAEIGRDAERVAEEVSQIQENAISKFEGMPWRQFTEGISPEEQKELAKASKKLERFAFPAKEKIPLVPEKPRGKTSFQEYMEKARAIGKTPTPVPEAPTKIPEEPEHVKLRARANMLQKQLEKMGYDQDFFNDVIKEGKSYSFNKPNSMTNDEVKASINRMLTYLKGSTTSRMLTRKEQKQVMRDKAIRAKIFNKLPEKPSVDLYHQVKEQFKDYKPATAHVFDYIRGVRHVFRKDRLLHDYGFKPLHDHAMAMEHFIVDNIRPARSVAKDIGANQDDRRLVTHYRNLKWLKMVNPDEYGPVQLPVLSEKQAKWDAFLTKEYERLAKIFNPRNLLPFDVYSPILFDDSADDPEMKILGTFYPEGVPKNIEAFFMKKRVSKDIKDKINEDSLVLLERYIRSGSKEYFLKDDVRRIRNDLLSDKHINESMRKILQSYTERVLGYPSYLDEVVSNTFATAINFMGRPVGMKKEYTAETTADLAHTFINLTYMSTMGLRPGPVLKNLTQSLNTAMELGPTWVTSGIIDFMFKGWAEADRAGVLTEYAPELYREYEEEDRFDRLRDVMLYGFQAADRINRSIAYYSAQNKFNAFAKIFRDPPKLKKWLLSHHLDKTKRDEVMDAINKGDMDRARHLFAEEIVAKTQYLYNKYDSPIITRSSLGKMYFQFASWPENYAELILDWGRNKNYAAFLRMTATTLGLGYIAKTTDKKWLKKFIYSMIPGAPLPLTEWKLHRYVVPPSLGPLENLLYIVGDVYSLSTMQDNPEEFQKKLDQKVKRLMLNTLNWAPGGLLAKDIYNWSSIPMEETGKPMYQPSRSSLPRNIGIGNQRASMPRR